MTLYTLETAIHALNEFKATKGLKNIHITVKMQGTTHKPFCATNQSYYCGYYETPEQAYNAVQAKRNNTNVGKPENLNKRFPLTANEKLQELAGACIEKKQYDRAMHYATKLNDKTLINFITRLSRTQPNKAA